MYKQIKLLCEEISDLKILFHQVITFYMHHAKGNKHFETTDDRGKYIHDRSFGSQKPSQ